MITKKQMLINIGSLLIVFGAIESIPNILSGLGGPVLIIAGAIVLIFAFTRKSENKE